MAQNPVILHNGQSVHTQLSGAACAVEQYLGGGGQGEVYRASLAGQPVALKWYFPTQATAAQRKALETLVQKGAPTAKFLWPIDIAISPRVPGFGYVMPLREPRYRGIVDLMKRRVEPSFRALATAGLGLAHSFLSLHAQGLCYRDISFGNVFFDPQDGDVLICDNDNVTIDGVGHGGVLGTPRFMAPEVVRGEALPSTQTDLWSLAVLLFYMLLVHHPLEGKREAAIHALDLPAMNRLYGTHALFIYDPRDDSNRPVPGLHDNAIVFWKLYPQFLRELFTRAFTAGVRDPHGRVRESEWRAALVRLRDAIVLCSACGVENFYDADALKRGVHTRCWSCSAEVVLPPRIRIGRQVVMLNAGSQLFAHHVDEQQMYNFSIPVAAAGAQKQPALKNLSAAKWTVTQADGKHSEVKPGQSVALKNGTKIAFGKCVGEVRI
jgi:DNA-binding helix-hairpin-helix protein with protein kinase domain